MNRMLDDLAKKGVFRLMPGAPFGFDESKDQRHAAHIPLRHKGLVFGRNSEILRCAQNDKNSARAALSDTLKLSWIMP
jgi:hypothetical protein